MGPYSHFTQAVNLEQYLQPERPQEYYWGSIVPDIRYLTKMRRDQTHLEQERLQRFADIYPHLGSFLLGYRVHCLIDQIDFPRLVMAAFPLNILRPALSKYFSQQQMAMLVEMYYLQSAAAAGELAGGYNEVLNDLGITPEQTGVFSEAMRTYIAAHSFEAAVSAFQKIGMIENARLEKYMKIYQSMKKQKLLTAIFMIGVKNARLDQHVINHVQQSL